MSAPIPPRRRRRRWGRLVLAVLFLLAIGTGVFAGMCAYQVISGLDGDGSRGGLQTLTETPFDNKQKVFILVLGVDEKNRLLKTDGRRSDTMILLAAELEQKRLAALSLPRDTRVQIPGRSGYDKLNAAHFYGGVPLVRQTVTQMLGIPIDRFVKTDVAGFRAMVDLIGPIEIDVEKRMDYDDNWGNLHIHLKPGRQLLDGEKAMGYVRFRHDSTGDLGRMKRQQKFMRAVVRQLFTMGNIARLPQIIEKGMEYIETDLTARELLVLANLAREVTMSQITTATLPGTPRYIRQVSYYVPDEERTVALIQKLFFSQAQPAYATVEVLNGNGLPGIAREAARQVSKGGFHVSRTGNADNYDYERTEVRADEEHLADARRVASLLGVGETAVVGVPEEPAESREAPRKEPRIVVVLGKDYRP
ncbi:MAG: LCP family protein [Armatimonadetes bacterium]|nr:LCP family protein [Armatimonadota bacterium]